MNQHSINKQCEVLGAVEHKSPGSDVHSPGLEASSPQSRALSYCQQSLGKRALTKEDFVTILTTAAARLSKDPCTCRKCPIHRFARLQHERLRPVSSRSPRPNPLAADQKLGLHIIQHLSHLHPHSAWLELAFCRLGHSASVDLAALALGEALDFHFGGSKDLRRSNAGLLCYGKAVKHLKNDMSKGHDLKDGPLIAVSMLAIFEFMMSSISATRQRNIFLHWSGLRALLLDQNPGELSDVGIAILYSFWEASFDTAMSRGLPSAFEGPQWTSLQPASFHGISETQIILRINAHETLIRVPRLMQQLRQMREGNSSEELAHRTTRLASSLLNLQNDTVASNISNEAAISMTKDPLSRSVVPLSYTFPSPDDLSAIVLDGTMRLFIMNICIKLAEIHQPARCIFDLQKLREDVRRTSEQLIMCWEHAESIGPFETLWVIKGLLHIWPHLRSSQIRKPTERGQRMLDWILPKLNHPFNEWLTEDMTVEQCDIAADLSVGGPLDGVIANAGVTVSPTSFV